MLFSAAPPERPTAPKPGRQPPLPAAAFQLPQDAVLGMPGSSVMGMPQMPSSEAPKLKDFLPFMKPGSFGPKAGSHMSNDCAPGSAGSLPASVSASPVHLPQASVSFPPSPQRQPPTSLPTSNGYVEMPWTAGAAAGLAHSDAGYPVAEVLLSPTAPPGAPRSASPAHQPLPPTVAHPGGPAETHQPYRPANTSYNIPQNYSQPSVSQSSAAAGVGIQPVPGIASGHAGAPGQNGYASHSRGNVQMIGQAPAPSNPVYSGHSVSQPGIGTSGVPVQQAFPGSMSSFQDQVSGQPSVVSNAAAVPPGSGSYSQHGGLPQSVPAVSASADQSYLGGNVGASNIQQPGTFAALPNVAIRHQFNNSNNAPGQFSFAGGPTQPSSVEVSAPYYYQPPAAVPPPPNAVQLPRQSAPGPVVRPPSYELVTQHYPPQAQPVSSQPSFTGPPAGVTLPMQTSYPVRPEATYGGVHAVGSLPIGNQQHPVASQPPQQPPAAHHVTSASQGPFVPAQHPVMPPSSSFMQQQQQSRYQAPSQTVPGLPVPGQHVPGRAPGQAQYPPNVAMSAAQPQPRYPTMPATASHPYPAGQQPVYQNMGPQSTAGQIQPLRGQLHQQQYQQPHPGQPVRPEVGHAMGYPPGRSPQVRFPDPAYPASSQPASVYRQPPPVISHQQVPYQPAQSAQQQPLYHPGSSQPPRANQSATAVSYNFSPAAQTPYTNQPQPAPAGTTYSPSASNAAGEMQSLVDIPVCLPSPLQPSRVSAAAELSKNVDSLRDLDLSGKTTASADDAEARQGDAGGKPSVEDTAESRDAGKLDEPSGKPEEELRHVSHQSPGSRDVYADSDMMARFVAEVEKFQKHVDSLLKPTLGGYFPLDKEWKVSCLLCGVFETILWRWYFLCYCFCIFNALTIPVLSDL